MKKIKLKLLTLTGFLLLQTSGGRLNAMDTAFVHQMVVFLQQQQSDSSLHFPKGLFPSFRQYAYSPTLLKSDDNLFFTASVLFILNNIYPKLPATDQEIVDQIRKKAIPAFSKFKNKNGGNTYNFWSTNPPKVFPNSGWLNWFDKSQSLPDDFDDTSIGLLAKQADTGTAKAVHNHMQNFTNHPGKPIKNTYKKYQNIPAYSVWFGKNFPVDFDICVLSNVLSFVSDYRLPWTQADSASLKLIEAMIANGDVFSHPSYISPHYHTSAIILYHLSRLTASNPHIILPNQEQLVAAAEKLFKESNNAVEKAMLATTLKRWGANTPVQVIQNKNISGFAYGDFVFFIANMASMLPNPLKSILGKSGIGSFNYYCPALNVALTLESELTEIPKGEIPNAIKKQGAALNTDLNR